MNSKMLLAPILAVALVLSLAAAVSVLPSFPHTSPQNQKPSVQSTPTPAIYWNATPLPSTSAGSYNVNTPAPTTAPVLAPTATPVSQISTIRGDYLPILSIIAALIIGVVAALLLFSERSLRKELGKE